MSTDIRPDVGLLLLRLGVGGTLIAHGTQKLFGWFGGHGIEGTAGGMEAMGFQPPRTNAVLAGLGETGGGLLLALGLATPVGGAAAASTMAAAGSVHAPAGFFSTEGGFEYPGVLAVSGVALAVAGPGRYSLDAVLDHRLNRPWLMTTALSVLGAATAAVIALRSRNLASAAPTAADQPGEGMQAAAHGD